jgi:two-component system cell cycle response regulator CtrA
MKVLLNASNVLPDVALCLKYGASERVLRIGNVTLSLERNEVAAGGQVVELTRKEFALLQLLMMRKNVVMAKEAILEQIYGSLDKPDP